MPGVNGSQSWIWTSVVGLMAGLLGSYMVFQVTTEGRISTLEAGLASEINSRKDYSKRTGEWIIRTEKDRFRKIDGINLEQRIDRHIKIKWHGLVGVKLADMEARLKNLERRNSDATGE